jgi:beta-galactosidase
LDGCSVYFIGELVELSDKIKILVVMRKIYCVVFAVTLIFISCQKQSTGRIQICFDEGWKFIRQDIKDASRADFDDSKWRQLDLPHDWSIEDSVKGTNPSGTPHGFFIGETGWYRKKFDYSNDWINKRIYLLFDGVYMNSDVYLNGKYVGYQSYGYAPFYYDITSKLKEGENIIAVRVDNSKVPNDRWYPGAGIYRHVWIMAVNKVHVSTWGTYITTPEIDEKQALIAVRTKIKNSGLQDGSVTLVTEIINESGEKIAESEISEMIKPDEQKEDVQEIKVMDPVLWSVENPYLYIAQTTIRKNEEILDTYETIFGIRKVQFSPDSGFILNGRKVVMKGVCLHHDLGCLGAAVNTRAMERRFEILKQIGVNAIRLSHNPHDPDMLNLCDKMGFLVFDEAYDKWDNKWEKWGYKGGMAPFFENWEKDLTNFIDRDKNHPSVVIWSMGNETMEQVDYPAKGDSILKMMMTYVHRYEPSRNVTCAIIPAGEEPSRYIFTEDVVSYNYKTAKFDEWHKKYPEMIFLSSETKACREDTMKNYNDFDFLTNSWFDLHSYACGQFIWEGIDYYGESKGWPDRGNRSGILYTTGFRKPNSYFTESIYSDKPMVALAVHDDSIANLLNNFGSWQLTWMEAPMSRHWNWEKKDGKMVKVYIMSNCEKVKLFLNGNMQVALAPYSFKDGVARVELPWKPGVLMTVGINKDSEVCRDSLVTAGKPKKIELIPDRNIIKGDGLDISNIEVRITDNKGIICPLEKSLVQFEVTGDGFIAGVDNGDMADHFNLKGNALKVKDGKCLLVVQSKKQKGEIKIKATGINLQEAELNIISK